MGSRNLDRVPLIDRRRKEGETVGEMLVNRWRVRLFCPACRVTLIVSLEPIIAVKGQGFSLWDRKMRCRNADCRARPLAQLQAMAPGMAYFQPLVTPPPAPPPLGWAERRIAEVAAERAARRDDELG